MNPNNPHGFQYTRRVGGGATPLEQGSTAPGVTLYRGQALVREEGLIRGVKREDREILGVASEGITGVEGYSQEITYVPALPDLVFAGQVRGSVDLRVVGKRIGVCGSDGAMSLDPDSDTGVAQIIGAKAGSEWGEHTELYFIWSKSQFCGRS